MKTHTLEDLLVRLLALDSAGHLALYVDADGGRCYIGVRYGVPLGDRTVHGDTYAVLLQEVHRVIRSIEVAS